jgi:hypothetical protein
MRNVCAERKDMLFVNDVLLVSKAERTEVLHGRSHDNLFNKALNEIGQCYLSEASFTFATCTALALCTVGERRLGMGIRSSLLGPPTTGQLATARLPPLGGWVIYF